jgi:hypothetical protein
MLIGAPGRFEAFLDARGRGECAEHVAVCLRGACLDHLLTLYSVGVPEVRGYPTRSFSGTRWTGSPPRPGRSSSCFPPEMREAAYVLFDNVLRGK